MINVAQFEVLFQHWTGRCEKIDEKSQEQKCEVGTLEYEAGMVIHSDSTFSINNCSRQIVMYTYIYTYISYHSVWSTIIVVMTTVRLENCHILSK
jgi:hypothetical protein